MTAIFKHTCMLFLVALLFSCNNHKPKNTLSNKNETAAKNLALKYDAITNWDSIYYYTSVYQEMFIEENKLMLFQGRIYDIIKADSNYVVKVLDERENSHQNFLALITFTPEQYDKIFYKNTSKSGSFIIRISKITSSNPSIKIDEGNDGEDTYTYSHLSDAKDETISIFYGQIIDFYLDEINLNKWS